MGVSTEKGYASTLRTFQMQYYQEAIKTKYNKLKYERFVLNSCLQDNKSIVNLLF